MWKWIRSPSDVDGDGANRPGVHRHEGLAKRDHESVHSPALLSILDALHGGGSNILSGEWWERAGRIGSMTKPHWGRMSSRTGRLPELVHLMEEPVILNA